MSTYAELKHRANEFHGHEKLPEAIKKYKEAIQATSDPMEIDHCEEQINSIRALINKDSSVATPQTNLSIVHVEEDQPAEEAPAEEKKKKKRGLFKLNIGQELIQFGIKKFLPKLKPIILKNKPKAIEFMQGKITMKGEPCEGEPQKRRILIELQENKDDPSKTDVLVQILKSDFSRVQYQKDAEGNSLAHEETYSITAFINQFLDTNLEEMAKELQNDEKVQEFLE